MTEETYAFNLTMSDEGPLKDSWDEYAQQLVASGAHPDQIETMKLAFYIGATQIFARISRSTENGKLFGNTMVGLSRELEFITKHNGFQTEGSA